MADWPAWDVPDPERAHEDGYGSLARYVDPHRFTEVHGAAFPTDLRARLKATWSGAELDRRIALSLFELLQAQHLRYAGPWWDRGGVQQIRDPDTLLTRTKHGTCIDLAVLLATACAAAGLDTHIAVQRFARGGHALVAIRTRDEPRPGEREPEPDGIAWHESGVAAVDLADLGPDWLLMDATHACHEQSGRPEPGRLHAVHAHLVRVPGAEPPYVPYERQTTLRQVLPEPEPVPKVVDVAISGVGDRKALIGALAHARGVVALRGTPGVGKSRLALEGARAWQAGFGWLLAGTTARARDLSIGQNEAFERNETMSVDPADIAPYVAAALHRLHGDEDDRWVVVLDNLDYQPRPDRRPPAWVSDLVPRHDNQLLIVTTNLEADELPPGWTVYDVPSADEIEPAIRWVAAGSVLLQSSFLKLIGGAGLEPDPSWATSGGTVGEGAAAYWSAVRGVLSDADRRTAERLAFLPPDDVVPADFPLPERLASLGVVTRAGDLVQMHRLIGAAVRSSLGPEETVAAARAVLEDRGLHTHLLRRADQVVTGRLHDAIRDSEDGSVLAALASIQEVHQPGQYVETFELAARHLDRDDPRHHGAYADCLHARARQTNQAPKATADEITAAIAWVVEAAGLRAPEDTAGRARHLAMQALLTKRRAALRPRNDPDRFRELTEAYDALESGYLRRCEDRNETLLSRDRAQFNLAGAHVDRAQTDGFEPVEEVGAALSVYAATAEFRRVNYGRNNPLTAVSIWGQGLAHYYLALLSTGTPQAEHLHKARDHAAESLDIRAELGNPGDVVKSASLLAKVAALHARVAAGTSGATVALADEIVTELAYYLDS